VLKFVLVVERNINTWGVTHKSDRLGVMIFTNSVTESVQILYRFQKLHCLPNEMLESVLVDYKKVVDAFLILLVLKFHN
jgi:hypothetical protein